MVPLRTRFLGYCWGAVFGQIPFSSRKWDSAFFARGKKKSKIFQPKIFLGELWEGSGRALGELWESSGRLLGDFWETSGRALGELVDTRFDIFCTKNVAFWCVFTKNVAFLASIYQNCGVFGIHCNPHFCVAPGPSPAPRRATERHQNHFYPQNFCGLVRGKTSWRRKHHGAENNDKGSPD